MKNYSLGEFEELILLLVAGSDGEAYGVTIQKGVFLPRDFLFLVS